jgi:Legume lectin domain/Chitobiase/beta-hexosaminidase C-terminal domain
MKKRMRLGLGALFTVGSLVAHAAAVNVPTWRYDATRTGQNINETQLTPANVNASNFGKLFSYVVDGYVYAQPLFVGALPIGGVSHNVVFVTTEHDSVYAFDANQNLQLWKANLIDSAHGAPAGATPVPSGDVGTNDIVPEIGVTGTPVIDTVTNTLYVVSKSKENGVYVHRLHALDLLTGSEKSSSPVVIQGSVKGGGIGSVNGSVAFQPQWQLNRTGLLLFNGNVYVAFAAHGDNGPYHGWLFAFNALNLQQTAVFNSSPEGKGNGIWHSGAALAADIVNGVPRLFCATGNFFSTNSVGPNPKIPYTNDQNYSNAILRFDLSGANLQVSDEWTPFDQLQLSNADTDQTSGGIVLLPDQGGAHVHELIQVGKNGRIEVLDRDNLGGFNTGFNAIAQEVSGQSSGLWSTPAYWNSRVYFWGSGDRLKQFALTNGQLSATPTVISTVTSSFPGVSPVISSNGTAQGILWAVRSDAYNSNGPSILYAFDATNVGTQLYNSTQNAARDSAGKAVKFVVPVITDGKVYVGTQGQVDVYGLLATAIATVPSPTLSPTPGAYPSAPSVAMSDSLSGAAIHYTTDGSPPSINSPRYSGPITLSSTTTVQALAVAPGYNNSSVVSGTYTIGVAPTIDFSNGFASVKGLTLNGSAVNSDDSRLQLTTGAANQAGSFFANTLVNIQHFTSDFTLQLSGTAPLADGITFTIQTDAPTALGPLGGGLGYGPDSPKGSGGIKHSVAVKFDVYSNAGESANSTGVYVNGASPTTPSVDLTSSGVVLSSGDAISAHLVYDGTYLNLTLKDPVNNHVYSGRFAIDIPTAIGATTAYVGFTGGTGGLFASQKILTWSFTSQANLTSTTYQTTTLNGKSSGPTFRQIAWSGFPDGSGTILDSTKAGDSVTFTFNIATPGTYDLNVTSKNFNIRGMWQLSLDGINVGSVQDEYNANEKYVAFDVGPIFIGTAGNHSFKFTVTGRNAAATDYKISFDYLQLNQQ